MAPRGDKMKRFQLCDTSILSGAHRMGLLDSCSNSERPHPICKTYSPHRKLFWTAPCPRSPKPLNPKPLKSLHSALPSSSNPPHNQHSTPTLTTPFRHLPKAQTLNPRSYRVTFKTKPFHLRQRNLGILG